MATPDTTARSAGANELARSWKRLGRAATFVAILTSPIAFTFFHYQSHWSIGWSVLGTVVAVVAFRGFIDLLTRRFIPWPSLFGASDAELRADDLLNRRRSWFWSRRYRLVIFVVVLITIVYLIKVLAHGADNASWVGVATGFIHSLGKLLQSRTLWIQMLFVFFLFFANILLFMGPMMMMGISQIKGFEPGDADWGVRLDDVRGQKEAKEEIRRIVELWQSGDAFEAAGGKRERGIIFFGAPGTGKTMLAKAIATGFNSPFVTIPGSGFAQTFIGVDALIVRYLASKAKRLARKWGGQCIVFIDEIDAVGMRRQSLGGQRITAPGVQSIHDLCFFGDRGALNVSGDLILETAAWRERLFEQRAPERLSPYPPFLQKLGGTMNQAFPGMMGGGQGQLALNQLLVVMDGIDSPPFWRRFWTNRVNNLLDASFVVPRKVGKVRLRMKPPKPRGDQIYFIGATNVPLEMLDPALRRPGRMGRHIWFRTPTTEDRKDIFDLYLGKVAHEPELDTDERRDELSRVTSGYSPAMIEQVCSMALTYAQHEGRARFGWLDLLEAMTTVESGTAIGQEYIPDEKRSIAIHEAGHAIAAHVYMQGSESTRLSIKRRGSSGGHHSARDKEERFVQWRHEEVGRLIWSLGAMAAERVFYGENTTGVGGDVQSATALAAWMVGASAMAPDLPVLPGWWTDDDARDAAEEKIMKRYERIGNQIMNRTGGGPLTADPISGVLGDPNKRRMAAQLLGQAYMAAHLLVAANRSGIENVAAAVIEKSEIYGNELIALLDAQNLQIPTADLTKDETWPKL